MTLDERIYLSIDATLEIQGFFSLDFKKAINDFYRHLSHPLSNWVESNPKLAYLEDFGIEYAEEFKGFIFAFGDVSLADKELKKFPFKVDVLFGDLQCDCNNFKSLKGFPSLVVGDLSAEACLLKSVGKDIIVTGDLNLSHNYIESLDGEIHVGGNIDLARNSLSNFKGLDPILRGSLDMYYNNLDSFEGCPHTIYGDLNLTDCGLSSFEGSPSYVEGACLLGGNIFSSYKGYNIVSSKGVHVGIVCNKKGFPKILNDDRKSMGLSIVDYLRSGSQFNKREVKSAKDHLTERGYLEKYEPSSLDILLRSNKGVLSKEYTSDPKILELVSWLNSVCDSYTIYKDYSVDIIDERVFIEGSFPKQYKINQIVGNVHIIDYEARDLKGFPKKIQGGLYFSEGNLESLKGDLESLEGELFLNSLPNFKTLGGEKFLEDYSDVIEIIRCPLETLNLDDEISFSLKLSHITDVDNLRFPKTIKGDLEVRYTDLSTLKNFPKVVRGNLDISFNPCLKSLKNIPHFYGANLSNCNLKSLKGIQKFVNGDLELISNRVWHNFYTPKIVVGYFASDNPILKSRKTL